jgi:beta-lactamase superfamily II metal-dependent hydrolase
MHTRLMCCLAAIFSLAACTAAQTRAARNTLDIYVIDVEGGNSVLFVAPSGESVLIDTGNVAPGAVRDAGRIMEAIRDAGISQIDHLITTHWHGDHFGGLAELASQIRIKQFIDHGPNVQPDPQTDEFLQKIYPELYARATHMVVKAGDEIPVKGLNWRVVAAAGEVIKSPLPGAGKANPYCATFQPGDNNAEDPQSVASFIQFGNFRTVHLGDLTKNKEFELMCPNNPIGTVDLLLGLHHGVISSNSAVLVHALHPRVAIMNNGTRKGGVPEVMKTVYSSPGLEDLWQMHFSVLGGQEYTVPGAFIANTVDDPQPSMPIEPMPAPPAGPNSPPPPQHNGTAYWIKVSARPDGSFTVTNARNGFSKTYGSEPRN